MTTTLILDEENWRLVRKQLGRKDPLRAVVSDMIEDCMTFGTATAEVGEYDLDAKDIEVLDRIVSELDQPL